MRVLVHHLKVLPKATKLAPGQTTPNPHRTLYDMAKCENMLGVGTRDLPVRAHCTKPLQSKPCCR